MRMASEKTMANERARGAAVGAGGLFGLSADLFKLPDVVDEPLAGGDVHDPDGFRGAA